MFKPQKSIQRQMKTSTPMIPHVVRLLLLFRLRRISWQKRHFITKQTVIFCRLHTEKPCCYLFQGSSATLSADSSPLLRFFCRIHTNNEKTVTATGDSDANYWMHDSSNVLLLYFWTSPSSPSCLSLFSLSLHPTESVHTPPPIPFFLRLHGNSLEVTVLLTQAESDHTSR